MEQVKEVWVVTGTELGWDCVVGVFDQDKVSKEDLGKVYPERAYVIHNKTVKTEAEIY